MTNTGTRSFRSGLTAVLTAACLSLTVTPASAAGSAGSATLGQAKILKRGQAPVAIPAQAPCDLDGPTVASSTAVTKPGIRFGGGTSQCTTVDDRSSGEVTTTSEAVGRDFELSTLRSADGPVIKIRKYRATCTATSQGTEADWSIRGLSGISDLPERIPANYVHPVTTSDGTVLAQAIFNERPLPEPDDGSIIVRALHIKFAPASRITGDVIIGAVSCSPTD